MATYVLVMSMALNVLGVFHTILLLIMVVLVHMVCELASLKDK